MDRTSRARERSSRITLLLNAQGVAMVSPGASRVGGSTWPRNRAERRDRGERVEAGAYFLRVTRDGQPVGAKKLLILR